MNNQQTDRRIRFIKASAKIVGELDADYILFNIESAARICSKNILYIHI